MKKKEIHFSVENLQISKSKDINKIEDIWSIRQILPETSKIANSLS